MKIHVFKSRTVNLGNYNSTKFVYGLEEDVDDTVSDREIRQLYQRFNKLVDEQVEDEHGKWNFKD